MLVAGLFVSFQVGRLNERVHNLVFQQVPIICVYFIKHIIEYLADFFWAPPESGEQYKCNDMEMPVFSKEYMITISSHTDLQE